MSLSWLRCFIIGKPKNRKIDKTIQNVNETMLVPKGKEYHFDQLKKAFIRDLVKYWGLFKKDTKNSRNKMKQQTTLQGSEMSVHCCAVAVSLRHH